MVSWWDISLKSSDKCMFHNTIFFTLWMHFVFSYPMNLPQNSQFHSQIIVLTSNSSFYLWIMKLLRLISSPYYVCLKLLWPYLCFLNTQLNTGIHIKCWIFTQNSFIISFTVIYACTKVYNRMRPAPCPNSICQTICLYWIHFCQWQNKVNSSSSCFHLLLLLTSDVRVFNNSC